MTRILFRDSVRATCLSIVALNLLLQPIGFHAQDNPKYMDEATYSAAGKFGLANAEFFYVAFQPKPDLKLSNSEIKTALESAADSYKYTVATNRGPVHLLDSSLDVALAGTDFASGGTLFMATVPIRWAKGLAIDSLIAEIDTQATAVFAKNLSQIKTHTGLEYEQLQALSPEEKIAQADKIPDIFNLKQKLRGEGLATEVVDKLVIDTLTNVQKATLVDVAQNTQDITKLGNGLESVTRAMSKYVKENNARLDDITSRLSQVEQGLQQAKYEIDDLKLKSAHNTQQIRLIGDVLFSKSDPRDRLVMLNGGYLADRLDNAAIESIKKSLEADVRKQEIIGKMNSVVSDFNKIGTIASNLGINVEGLDTAISTANAVSGAITAFATGDYLGVIVGISGLFGKREDPNAKRHAQMMKYLQQQFAVVNRKLDQIIEGQQKIMEGIVQLSKQMAEYDKALHQRLTRIEDKIDSIENKTYALLYMRMGGCSSTYNVIRGEIGILDSTRIGDLKKIDDYNAGRVFECGEFLRSLYDSSFNPALPALESLALTNSSAAGTPAVYKLTNEEIQKYYADTKVQEFIEQYYRKTESFVIKRSKALGWTYPNLVSVLMTPSGSVRGLTKKLDSYDRARRACDKNTNLANSLLSLICPVNSRIDLPASSSPGIENTATTNSLRILHTPALYDATNSLAEWSLFYAPIYDVMQFTPGKKIAPDYFRMISKPSYRPSGKPLLQGAAKINAVSLAQMNMMQGDLTAKLIFDLLWNTDKKAFLTDGEITLPEQREAKEVLLKQNPFVLRNVLMLSLDASTTVSGPYAYRQAMDAAEAYTLDPFAGLRQIFGSKFIYQNIWEPNGQAPTEDQKKVCSTATETQTKPTSDCSPITTVNLYGVNVPMPSVNEFVARELIYPPSLTQMVNYRDRLATRLADYDFIDWAIRDAPDKKAARQTIIEAFITAAK